MITSGIMEALLALSSTVGATAVWKSLVDVGKVMISSASFLAFLVIGTIATLFMPPKAKSK